MTKKIYVTMTDRFFSGWGYAENRINKLIIICDNWQQADTIVKNAERRIEMRYINTTQTKPYYSPSRYYVSWKTYGELGAIWKK